MNENLAAMAIEYKEKYTELSTKTNLIEKIINRKNSKSRIPEIKTTAESLRNRTNSEVNSRKTSLQLPQGPITERNARKKEKTKGLTERRNNLKSNPKKIESTLTQPKTNKKLDKVRQDLLNLKNSLNNMINN